MNNTIRRTMSFLGAAVMATQLISATTPANAGLQGSSSAFEQAMPATPAQKEVENLLKQISSNAAIAGRHADALVSFTQGATRLQYESHAAQLTGAKEAINAMGSDFGKLQELRPAALPWQQLVIDRLEPILTGMAGHTTDAIEELSEGRWKLPASDYREAIGGLYTSAGEARNLLAVNLNYAQAREKLNRLDASSTESSAALAPEASRPTPIAAKSKTTKSLEQRVQSALLMLPYYGVFDHLSFQVDGDRVTLHGQVNRPVLKTDAERAVGSVEGVASVVSTVEVLPLSPNDDRIRAQAYHAIYGHSTLVRYRLNANPPIRIIVKNGNVTLMGVVGSNLDRTIAHMQANSVPGAFSVTNNLQVGS